MATWILFTLIKRPFYDAKGNILASIKGRRNRKGIDEFTGGGWVCPDLSKVKVLQFHYKGPELLVQVEGDQAAIDALTKQESVTYQASPTTALTVPEGLQQTILTDAEAAVTKVSIGIDAVSGVTK